MSPCAAAASAYQNGSSDLCVFAWLVRCIVALTLVVTVTNVGEWAANSGVRQSALLVPLNVTCAYTIVVLWSTTTSTPAAVPLRTAACSRCCCCCCCCCKCRHRRRRRCCKEERLQHKFNVRFGMVLRCHYICCYCCEVVVFSELMVDSSWQSVAVGRIYGCTAPNHIARGR